MIANPIRECAGSAFHGVDLQDILIELGRREAMAGQEDWVIDEVQSLAAETQWWLLFNIVS